MVKNIYVNKGFNAEECDNINRYEETLASDRYREYRRKWLKNPKNMILEKAPLHIDIDPTNFCNLKCTMCTRTVRKETENEKFTVMDFDLYKRIVDEAAAAGVPSIKFGIVSEPLLHKRFVEMIQYASDKKFVDIGLVTNATLLNEELSYSLIKAGLVKINVSFDSPVKSTYESIRVGADFDKTLNNMKKLIEIRDKMNSPTPLMRVTMVKMQQNERERDLFVKLFKPFVDRIAFLDYEEYDEALADFDLLNRPELDNFACSELWQRLTIDCNGRVYPCCSGTIYKEFSWDFNQNGLEKIWVERVQVLRDKFNNDAWKDVAMCRKCLGRVRDVSTLSDGKV